MTRTRRALKMDGKVYIYVHFFVKVVSECRKFTQISTLYQYRTSDCTFASMFIYNRKGLVVLLVLELACSFQNAVLR